METAQTSYAVCKRNEGYSASLELGRAYKVLPDPKAAEHGLLRVVDESGEDYLYPQEYFAEHRATPSRRISWWWVSLPAILVLLRRARERAKR